MKKPSQDEDLPGESLLKKAKGANFFSSADEQPNTLRQKPSSSKLTRRLDSLARLLEGGMICAAVYLDTNSVLYVSTNAIHLTKQNFPNNMKTKYLIDIFVHFMSGEFTNSELNHISPGDIEILIKIFNNKMAADFRGDLKTMPVLSDYALRKMLIFFSKNIDGAIRILSDEILSQFLDQTELNTFNNRDSASIKLLTMLQKKLTDLRQAYMRLWGHFRDYLKFKNIIINREIVIKDFCILAIGDENEHAELRMLSFLLSNYHILSPDKFFLDKHYIGIAKLCCPNCICAVRSVNACFNIHAKMDKETKTEITTVFDSDNPNFSIGEIGLDCEQELLVQSIDLEAQELVQSELLIDSNESNVNVRGSHDLVVLKWVKPTFLLGEKFLSSDNYLVWSFLKYSQNKESKNAGWVKEKSPSMSEDEQIKIKVLAEKYTEMESSVAKIRQKTIEEIRTNMYASPSSSDVQVSPPSNITTVTGVEIDDPLQILLDPK